jgi:hypothetical protein
MSDDTRNREERAARTSDVPLDLAKERETFVRSFFKRGVELTESLMHENEELRERLEHLEQDNAKLRAQIASDDAIRDLLRTIEKLEAERAALMQRSESLEATRRSVEGRQEEIEQEVNDLANLYIASHQLHNSLSVRRVIRHLRDLCGQLVGALGFVIYLRDGSGSVVKPFAWEGLGTDDIPSVTVGEGVTGDAFVTGIPLVREGIAAQGGQGTFDDPVAVIPLMVQDTVVGAIAIITMLEQKERWASVDRELLKLLGGQAGVALVAANLFAEVEDPFKALAGLDKRL